jgi:hypothetical protein
MNKKIFLAIIIAVLVVTAFVFVGLWRSKNNNIAPVGGGKNTVPAVQKNNAAKETPVTTDDKEIQAIEKDLSTIDESEFNIADLSDENMGL